MPGKLIAGNWKMNGNQAQAVALAVALAEKQRGSADLACEFLVCPPAPYLIPVGEALAGSAIALGAQDCHGAASGAHTGDLGAPMLADVGCHYVIVGHSERRGDHGETDAQVKAKAEAALESGLIPIVCVGETAAERAAGETLSVIDSQVEQSLPAKGPGGSSGGELVVAYEPIWAVGSGKVASIADVAAVHSQIRAVLERRWGGETAAGVRLLYGGSVKPGNAAELLAVANVDGALVGGASLVAEDFWAIGTAGP